MQDHAGNEQPLKERYRFMSPSDVLEAMKLRYRGTHQAKSCNQAEVCENMQTPTLVISPF
jgi:hypothetical protein